MHHAVRPNRKRLRALLGGLAFMLSIAPITICAAEVTGVVKVTSAPPGAAVYAGGKVRGTTPAIIELPIGLQAVIVSRDGFAPMTKKVMVIKDRVGRVHAALKHKAGATAVRVHDPAPGQPDAGPGTVTLATQPPGLTVFMNDLLVPQPTPVAFDIEAGVYELRLEQSGQPVYRKTVFVRAGKTSELEISVKRVRLIDDADPWQ